MPRKMTYDTSIGSEERSVIAFTKTWGIVVAILFLIGIGILAWLYFGQGDTRGSGGLNSENTATRPAEP